LANLAKTNAQWKQFVKETMFFLGLLRCLREYRDSVFLQRLQFVNENDATSSTAHFTAIALTGIDLDVNTSSAGILYVRITANGGNWDIKLYTATGASGLVGTATNVAASAAGTIVADNSSGLGGTITLGATIAAETNDRHQIRCFPDWRARLDYVFDNDDEDEQFSRAAALGLCEDLTALFDSGIALCKSRLEEFLLSAPGNPVARGNTFLSTSQARLISNVAREDDDGNVSRVVTGLFPWLRLAMEDEATGSEQDVVKIVPSAAAGVFEAGNDGLGAVAQHTPGEECPSSLWQFYCTAGVDTGDLGKERFRVVVGFTGSGDDRTLSISEGPVVGRTWEGPLGFGPITITRTFTKTGDGTHVDFAAATGATAPTVTGITNNNSNSGVLYCKIVTGSTWTVNVYKSSSYATADLVASATGVSTNAAFTANAQNGSGLTVAWKSGTAPTNGNTVTLDVNGFHAENSDKVPDAFSVTVTVEASPGLIQSLIADEFGTRLNSDTRGSEQIPDDMLRIGTFVPFISEDN